MLPDPYCEYCVEFYEITYSEYIPCDDSSGGVEPGGGSSGNDGSSGGSGGDNGGNSGPSVPINEEEDDDDKPCAGNPIKNPEIAPQTWSLVKGARFGADARKKWQKDTDGKFVLDADGNKILIDKPHDGLDIKNQKGDNVFSMFDGQIIKTGFDEDGWGNYIMVKSTYQGKTIIVLYAHLDSFAKTSGYVDSGTSLGKAGNSGNLKTSIDQGTAIQHLHIEVREGTNWETAIKKNPENYMTTKYTNDGAIIESTNC